MRVGVYVHGHPDLRAGGSEIAAYSLYRGLSTNVDDAYFFASIESNVELLDGNLGHFSADGKEILIPNLVTEYFYVTGRFNQRVLEQIVETVRRADLDILHFHHCLGLGVDGILYLRGRLPSVRFIYTAHEYLTICARDGQLLRSPEMHSKRCEGAAPAKCSLCMPQFTPAQFSAREAMFRQFLSCFDVVISPSAFLADKIEKLGATTKIAVLPNSVPSADRIIDEPNPASKDLNKFGFFGQINPYKGLNVFLAGANIYNKKHEGNAKFSVFGRVATGGDPNAGEKVRASIRDTKGAEYRGPYDSTNIIELMSEVDWIVVPSIWWENSPVVIEEALSAGRPVICSDIGGMAEKVEDRISGLHFRAGSPADLARVFEECRGNEKLWRSIAQTRRRPTSTASVVDLHVQLYEGVLADNWSRLPAEIDA